MPKTYRVLITDRAWPDCKLERQILQRANAEIIEPAGTDEQSLVDAAGDCDAIATCWAQVTDRVIRAAPNCRIVARFGIGLDNIAVDTATELGIPVTFVPDYCVNEVADHTLAMLLTLSRRVAVYDARAKRGEYNRLVDPPMRRLSEQTLGLIGFGRIGRAVFSRAKAFGLSVIANSPSGNDHGTGCRFGTLEELLAGSDFVSLHCPLTEGTQHLIGESQFSQMRSTACLINTSRGGLVDHTALWDAIQSGRLAGTALDVFDPEPPDLSGPLFRDERVLVTPHAAFLSADSLRELRTRTAQQVADALQAIRPANLVNPAVWPE